MLRNPFAPVTGLLALLLIRPLAPYGNVGLHANKKNKIKIIITNIVIKIACLYRLRSITKLNVGLLLLPLLPPPGSDYPSSRPVLFKGLLFLSPAPAFIRLPAILRLAVASGKGKYSLDSSPLAALVPLLLFSESSTSAAEGHGQ